MDVAPPHTLARRQALVPKNKTACSAGRFCEHADRLRAHNQHRNVRSLQNALRNAAQRQFFQPSAAVRAHHNQVSPNVFCHAHHAFVNSMAFTHQGLSGHASFIQKLFHVFKGFVAPRP